MIIRKATRKDFKQILELTLKNNEFHRKFMLIPLETKVKLKKEGSKELKKLLNNKQTSIFVAEEKEKIIAHITAQLKKKDSYTKPKIKGYIADTFVEKNCRKKGLTRALLIEATKWLRKNNATYVGLSVNARNKNAIKVWHKLGFQDTVITMSQRLTK